MIRIQNSQNYRCLDMRVADNAWYLRDFTNGTMTTITSWSRTVNPDEWYDVEFHVLSDGSATLFVNGTNLGNKAIGSLLNGQIGLSVQKGNTRFDDVCVQEGPPVAAFSGTPDCGDVPLTVQFTDESQGNITSWSWIFGDGGTIKRRLPPYQSCFRFRPLLA